MNRKTKALLKDTIIFAVGNLGSKIILFFLVPIYTNYLSTAEYGTADLVSTFATLLVPFTSFSISNAVIRFGMKERVKDEDVIKTSLPVLIISAVVTFLLMPLVGLYHVVAEWRVYLLITVFLTNLSEIEKSYLKVKNKNKAFSIIGITQTAVLAVTNIVLLSVLRLGVKGYLISNIVALVFSSIACFFIAYIHKDLFIGKFDKDLLGKMLRYSSPLIFSGISWWVLHSSDKIMIEWMIGLSVLGIYTAATKIPSLINVIIGIFNQAWVLSSIREIESSNDRNFYSYIFNEFIFILFGASLVFISICKPFMLHYVGGDFRESWRLTPFLMVAAVFYSIFAFIGSLYAAIQKSVRDMWTSVLCAVMNIIVNYVGIMTMGVWGAVVGTVSSYYVFSVIRLLDIRKMMSFDIDFKRLIISSLLIFIEAFCVTKEIFAIPISLMCFTVFFVIYYKYIKSIIRTHVQ